MILAAILMAQVAYCLIEGFWKWTGAMQAFESSYLAAKRFLQIATEAPEKWILDADLVGNLVYAVSLAVFGGPFLLVPLVIWSMLKRSRSACRFVGWLSLMHACTLPLLICVFSRANHLFDSPPLAWHDGWFRWGIGLPTWQAWLLPGLFMAEAFVALPLISGLGSSRRTIA